MNEWPPLDDPRWLPVTHVFARLYPHHYDLTERSAEGRLRLLNRYRDADGVWARKPVSFLCWAGLGLWGNGHVSVRRRYDRPQTGLSWWADARLSADSRRRGVAFMQPGLGHGILYMWLPDLEQFWPTVFAQIGVRSGGDQGVTIGWQEHARIKLRTIPRKLRQQLHNSRQLRTRIKRQLEEEGVTVPKDPKALLDIIHKFLRSG
jgi:hypothetical protein